jgi:hypothetical protein
MRSNDQVRGALAPSVDRMSHQLEEMTEVYAALRKIFQSEEATVDNDAEPSDLAEAMAALDTINPGSPEWGPAFLQLSELVEAHVSEEEHDLFRSRKSSAPSWQPAELG